MYLILIQHGPKLIFDLALKSDVPIPVFRKLISKQCQKLSL